MIVTSEKRAQLATIVTDLFAESQAEITRIIRAKVAYKLIEGKEPEFTYVSCSCMGDWCDMPILHGFRLDGFSIKELEEKWKKKRK